MVRAVVDIRSRLIDLAAQFLQLLGEVHHLDLGRIGLHPVGERRQVGAQGIDLAADLATPRLQGRDAIGDKPQVRALSRHPGLDRQNAGRVEVDVGNDRHVGVGRRVGRVWALGAGDDRQLCAAMVLHRDALRLGCAQLGIDQKIARLHVGINGLAKGHNRDALLGHERQGVEQVEDNVLIAGEHLATSIKPPSGEGDLSGGCLGGCKTHIALAAINRILDDMIERGGDPNGFTHVGDGLAVACHKEPVDEQLRGAWFRASDNPGANLSVIRWHAETRESNVRRTLALIRNAIRVMEMPALVEVTPGDRGRQAFSCNELALGRIQCCWLTGVDFSDRLGPYVDQLRVGINRCVGLAAEAIGVTGVPWDAHESPPDTDVVDEVRSRLRRGVQMNGRKRLMMSF
ncbi:MAG: hypothetical protein B7Y80_20015 [Hyphomicrobium sp. 32-62-53]|nr:MAG: hypothetical protein B7Y80_20015 [Hyphomicrobium sp. 32-62-53]